jgi:hypothetical protein
MHDETTRNGGGAGYGAAEGPELAARRPATAVPIPPFEAAWLSAVGGNGPRGRAVDSSRDADLQSAPAVSDGALRKWRNW